jgi:malonate transporter and related proteins
MDVFLDKFLFATSITGPICLMLFLGIYFRRSGLIDHHFIEVASKLVFNVTLPTLLFLSIINSNHDFTASASLVLFGIGANILFFIILTAITKYLFHQESDQGVIIQGAFRGNVAIIALAYVANAYGSDGLAIAALYVAGLTLMYNILGVVSLTPKGSSKGTQAVPILIKNLTKNPLIIAISLGVIFSQLQLPMPKIAADAGRYFANMTLPLALICSGGSLNLQQLSEDKAPAWFATAVKLLVCPMIFTGLAILLGFKGLELGIIFLTSSSPTAAASFIMAKAMGANATLAANIIVLTTLFSLLSATLGIFVLSNVSLI